MGYVINILDDHHIPYIIIKKRVKRLTIKYNLQMVLEIHQPVNFADINVIKFVEDHIDWILNHKPNKPIPHESYHDGDSYLMLGKEYTIEIVYSNHETVVLNNNKIMVYTSSDNKIEKLLEKFRYEYAEVVFNEILYKSFSKIKDYLDKYPTLTIKKAKSRWGCCYLKENRIMLNIALIHVPLALIEYVVFHELIHFIYPNHSKEFHEMLEKYVHNEKKKRNALKQYSVIYK